MMRKLLGVVLIVTAAAAGLLFVRRDSPPAPPAATPEAATALPAAPRRAAPRPIPRELRPEKRAERATPPPGQARLVAGIDAAQSPLDVEARFAVHSVVGRKADEGQQALAMDRAALDASLQRREQQIRDQQRQDVVTTVTRRAGALGVVAAPETITELLYQAAWIELSVDRCMVESKEASACSPLRDEMLDLARRFEAETGLSMEEFRTGELALDAPAFMDPHASP
jgi:hypothetical protein